MNALSSLANAHVTSGDLQYRYSWSASAQHDNPLLRGHPDRDLLNRSEGYEVLAFLNAFASSTHHGDTKAKFGKREALKAERALHSLVPSNIHSRARIMEWLRTNWTTVEQSA